MQPQPVEDDETQNQQNVNLIRHGYRLGVSGDDTIVVPNAFDGVDLALAKTLKPDFSKAVNMPGGVSKCCL
jgi:hypothetical protein